ncbi:hypothetical protein N7509_000505 [Penicillium cosmopolitanum]|uniref:Uncharacterized protein n=1 Tax=Penicillium cosmopolitanum TaxID=1131564 RepID=A0A9W9WAP8_9EURO|nr:uncharacterized protein N7509_000505 [Penicillium cosmopolitanum]KAJ5413878.1 hypothetical protein N7509_000505 [Penicillium cosmopolitanum]
MKERLSVIGASPAPGSTTGQFTRQLDSALPGPHMKMLHDNLEREKAPILAQLRTGHARLNG